MAKKVAKKKAAKQAAKKTAKKAAKKVAKPVAKKTAKKVSKPAAPKSSPKAGQPASAKSSVRELSGGPDLIADIFATRTSAGQLRAAAAGRTVGVTGWAFRYRDQGGCVFVDMRARSGIIQLVFDQSSIPEQFA